MSDSWWDARSLDRAWALVAERLEREGLVPRGMVTVPDLSREEQRALSDLLGRSVLTGRVRVDLAALDRRLRNRAGTGLVEAARTVLGRPLTDRPAVRAARAARLDEPYAAYAAWRDAHPDAASVGLDDRLDDWLSGLRRDGVLGRDADPGALVRDALAVVWHQRGHLGDTPARQPVRPDKRREPGRPSPLPPVARTELAARLLGDAHALDDDRRLAAVVLRAARILVGAGAPVGPADDGAGEGDAQDRDPGGLRLSVREEWESLGVLTDRISSSCLTVGLLPAGEGAPARRVVAYAGARAVLHLTWRDLDEGLRFTPGQTVLVCENPRVLESAADAGPPGVGVVCTSGRPALVVLEVLKRLQEAHAALHYHGDFDWAGVAMTNDVVRRFGARPWRMSTDDYVALPARLPLSGARVDASWDPELAPAMAQRGLAVHEEASLPDLTESMAELAGAG